RAVRRACARGAWAGGTVAFADGVAFPRVLSGDFGSCGRADTRDVWRQPTTAAAAGTNFAEGRAGSSGGGACAFRAALGGGPPRVVLGVRPAGGAVDDDKGSRSGVHW